MMGAERDLLAITERGLQTMTADDLRAVAKRMQIRIGELADELDKAKHERDALERAFGRAVVLPRLRFW